MKQAEIVQKPWGHEEWWAHCDKYVGKILYIKKDHRLSLQYHNVKEETMRVLSGTLTLTLGDQDIVMKPGDIAHIEPGVIHRMAANHDDVTVLEVSTPEVHDVVRVRDDYNRA